MYMCRLQESRGWGDNRKWKQKLPAAFEGDQIIVFTVNNWSPWLFLKKGLLCLFGDATSKVHTVQGKSFILSRDTLERQKPTSTGPQWTADGPLKFSGQGDCVQVFYGSWFLPLYVCPWALWDLGPCGENDKSSAEDSAEREAMSSRPFPDRWEAPVTTVCPGNLGA